MVVEQPERPLASTRALQPPRKLVPSMVALLRGERSIVVMLEHPAMKPLPTAVTERSGDRSMATRDLHCAKK